MQECRFVMLCMKTTPTGEERRPRFIKYTGSAQEAGRFNVLLSSEFNFGDYITQFDSPRTPARSRISDIRVFIHNSQAIDPDMQILEGLIRSPAQY